MTEQHSRLAVGIAGSPRRRGNSTSLLNAYLKGVASVGFATELVYLNGLTYRGCQACDRCVRGRPCLVEDDLNAVFPLLERASIWAMMESRANSRCSTIDCVTRRSSPTS
jgi:multimeric flavodoxin WrbA